MTQFTLRARASAHRVKTVVKQVRTKVSSSRKMDVNLQVKCTLINPNDHLFNKHGLSSSLSSSSQ